MVPFSKLPGDQFAKSASNVRQQKQAQATAALQKQMTPKQATAPAVWKNNRNPNASAATSPQAAAQQAQQKPAVWKNNRNPNAPATTRPGVATKESKYNQLDAILENVIS